LQRPITDLTDTLVTTHHRHNSNSKIDTYVTEFLIYNKRSIIVVHIFNPTGIALTAFFFFVIKGSILILIIFISTSTQTTTMIVSNPSISNYASLQNLNSNQVKCPCLNVNIPYGNVMSISPILHQICSSDYTSELWITLLSYSYVTFADYTTPSIWGDWHGFEGQHFQLLFSFCQLATKTIDDAIDRFNIQSIIN
jgi:hypothetical protein